MSQNATNGSGEHPNGRSAIDAMQKQLVQSGMKPADAERKARESARRVDKSQGR